MNNEPDNNLGRDPASRVWRPQRDNQEPARRSIPIAVRLVAGLASLVLVGTVLLLLPGVAIGRQLTLQEALFTATSALTVTGLSLTAPGRDLTLFGQVMLLVLVQIGGVGFMVLAVLAFRLIGRKIELADRLALRESLRLGGIRSIVSLTRQVLRTVLLIELAGATFLWLNWRDELGDTRAAFYGIFHAVTAFCNAGFDLFGGRNEFPNGLPNDTATLAILGSLIVIGGLGIPVISEVLLYTRQRQLSLHTRLTLYTSAGLIVLGALGYFLSEIRTGQTLELLPLDRQVALSVFQSVSARTAGFAAVPSFETLAPATQLLTIVLMFIGCAPASMGGGITTGTFIVLLLGLWGYARGLPTAQFGGRSIPPESIRRAGAVLTVSLFVVLLATWLILMTHDTTLDAALFEVVSAFATCGLTLAFTGSLNLFGQLLIMLVMFWGRLGALTIIVALAQQAPPPRVTYPEEQLLIG